MQIHRFAVAFGIAVCIFFTSANAQEKGRTPGRNPGGAPDTFKVETFKGAGGAEISYSLFSPSAPKDGEKLPLVLCLHGAGGNTTAADVLAAPDAQKKHPCFVMAPGCPKDARWVKFTSFRGKEDNRVVEPELIEAIDDLVKKHPIDADRIYVTGQSMGGFGTWGLIANHPEKFAAAAPVCGGWNPEDAAKFKDVPLWAFHGAKDPTVPVKFTQDMIAALKKAGGAPKYTEYPEVGHGSWGEAYATAELWDWMFAQRRTTK